MRRAVLAVLTCIGLAATSLAGQSAAAAEGEGGGLRQVEAGGQGLRFEMPAGLCRIDPSRGGAHAELWKRFTPRPERKAVLLALDLDCETVRMADEGKLQRPSQMAHLLALEPEEPIEPSLPKMLDTLEQRYGDLARRRGEAAPERDDRAVYTLQDRPAADGRAGLIGITAVTVVSGQAMMFTVIDFYRRTPLAELRRSAAKAIETLHEDSR